MTAPKPIRVQACEECGMEYQIKNSLSRFCSNACRLVAWNRAHPGYMVEAQRRYVAQVDKRALRRAYMREFHQRPESVERRRATSKERYKRNPAPVRKRAADWYATFRERAAENAKAWRQANQGLCIARSHDYRARLRGVESERVLIDVLFERDKGICGVCRTRVYKHARDKWMRPSHDHIVPVSLGGANTYANAQLAHRRCNSRRGNHGAAQMRLVG